MWPDVLKATGRVSGRLGGVSELIRLAGDLTRLTAINHRMACSSAQLGLSAGTSRSIRSRVRVAGGRHDPFRAVRSSNHRRPRRMGSPQTNGPSCYSRRPSDGRRLQPLGPVVGG